MGGCGSVGYRPPSAAFTSRLADFFRRRHQNVLAPQRPFGAGDHAAQYSGRHGCWRWLLAQLPQAFREPPWPAQWPWRLASACKTFRKDWRSPLPCAVRDSPVSRVSGTGNSPGWWNRSGAVIGAAAVITMRQIQPYALAFAAGAMIFVVIEELIPEAEQGQNTDIAHSPAAMIGFALMMGLGCCFRIKSHHHEKNQQAFPGCITGFDQFWAQ